METHKENLKAIADAIREKDGTTEPIVASTFPERIRAIEIADQMNQAQGVEIIAGDQIQIGDTVYTIDQEVENIQAESRMPALSGVQAAAVLPFYASGGDRLLVLGGSFGGRAKAYTGYNLETYAGDIPADGEGTALNGNVTAAAFSPTGELLVLGGDFAGRAKLYSVNGTTITYISDIPADTEGTVLNSSVKTAAFSPDGDLLVLGGYFASHAKLYSVSGSTITYVGDIPADMEGTVLDGTVNVAAFYKYLETVSLVLGGAFSGYAKIYSVNETAITYVSDIYADVNGTALSSTVNVAAFYKYLETVSLVLGGAFSGYAKIYSVNETAITYVSDIYADANGTALNGVVQALAFNPTSTRGLVLGGDFTGRAKIYSVNGTTITYINDIYADTEGMALNNPVYAAVFGSVDNILVLGGTFTGGAKRYFYGSNNSWNYAEDLYADSLPTTSLDSAAKNFAFSADSKLLVFSTVSGTKLYSVEHNRLAYLSDIYADSEGKDPVKNSSAAAFSPDGKVLVLGQGSAGANIYSTNGKSVTYKGKLPGKTEESELTSTVYCLSFSPDGNLLIVGSSYTSMRSAVYSVEGSKFTYLGPLYANAGTTVLNSYVTEAFFSPDGETLVACGRFTKGAKIYSVDGDTLTYVGDFPGPNGAASFPGYGVAASITRDGKLLAICSSSGPRAMLYKIEGTTVTWVCNIPADADGGSFTVQPASVAISPDGKALFVGGSARVGAKLYAIDGDNLSYIGVISADVDGAVIVGAVNASAFSPDGKLFALGGTFEGKGKTYPVAGGSVRYDMTRGEPAAGGNIPTSAAPCGVGYAKSAMADGETGTVVVIGEITGEATT